MGRGRGAPTGSRGGSLKRIATHGLVHSQRVLLALTQAGLSREDSYRLVQKNAMRAYLLMSSAFPSFSHFPTLSCPAIAAHPDDACASFSRETQTKLDGPHSGGPRQLG